MGIVGRSLFVQVDGAAQLIIELMSAHSATLSAHFAGGGAPPEPTVRPTTAAPSSEPTALRLEPSSSPSPAPDAVPECVRDCDRCGAACDGSCVPRDCSEADVTAILALCGTAGSSIEEMCALQDYVGATSQPTFGPTPSIAPPPPSAAPSHPTFSPTTRPPSSAPTPLDLAPSPSPVPTSRVALSSSQPTPLGVAPSSPPTGFPSYRPTSFPSESPTAFPSYSPTRFPTARSPEEEGREALDDFEGAPPPSDDGGAFGSYNSSLFCQRRCSYD